MQEMDIPRISYWASMVLLMQNGFYGNTLLDIGAAEGAFFIDRRRLGLFPNAKHFFVDAMEENESQYKKLAAAFGADYAITGLSCMEGSVNISVDPNFYNTHITSVQNTDHSSTRTIPVTTLDKLVASKSLEAPYILKIDVQGSELDVLRGAITTLKQAVVVAVEIQIFFERDTIVELLSFMQGLGFVLFDITNLAYYPASNILYECYVTFIQKSMDFRKKLKWCLPEQELIVNQQLQTRRADFINKIDDLVSSQGRT